VAENREHADNGGEQRKPETPTRESRAFVHNPYPLYP
jgi:hypothetical protein